MPQVLDRPTLDNTLKDGWPSRVDMKIICPGLVRYSDLKNAKGELVTGDVLVTKEALDRMANSLEGKPIINWDHRKVSSNEYSKGRFQGIITGPAVFNSADGWYHAPGYVWDEATRKNIADGYSISCAYTVSDWGDGEGTFNAVPYLNEVKNGNYTHIAVVANPRYEGARIEMFNSKGGHMSLLSLFRKDKPEEKIEIDLKTPVTLSNGSSATLEEMANSFVEQEKAAEELKNKQLEDDRIVEVNGKKMTVKELKNAYEAKMTAEGSVKMKNSHDAGEHSSVPMNNCAMCNAAEEEKKKKDEEEKNRKNAADAEEKKKKDDEERKNAMAKTEAEKTEALKRAQDLENARNKGGKLEMPKITTLADRVAEGEARYGGPVAAAK